MFVEICFDGKLKNKLVKKVKKDKVVIFLFSFWLRLRLCVIWDSVDVLHMFKNKMQTIQMYRL